MKNAKKIIAAIAVVVLAGAVIGYFQYNKPHRDATEEKVAFTLDAPALFTAFESDEAAALAKYGNQLIAVSGTVREYMPGNGSGAMVVLDSEHPIFGVKCMFVDAPKNTIESGQEVEIKGFCSGVNGDVELTRCALAEKP